MAEIDTKTLGFELIHIGINCENEEEALKVANLFGLAFGFELKIGSSSVFVSSDIEVMKSTNKGKNGHIAIKTSDINKAIEYLSSRGFEIDEDTKKYRDNKLFFVYLKESFGGFAVHLIEK